MGLGAGDIFSAGQLGKKGFDKAFKSDPVWNLRRLVRDTVGRRHEVSPHREAVLKRIEGLWVDPAMIGHLQTLLTRGDTAEFVPLRQTLERLLVFGDNQTENATVVAVVLEAIRDNLPRAAQDAREGAHVDELLTRSETRSGLERVEEQLQTLREDLSESRAFAPFDASRLVGVIATDAAAIVTDLGKTEPGEATKLAQALQAGGEERAVELLANPQEWVVNGSAELFAALGRLAAGTTAYAEAQRAFIRAAEHPAVRDRPRQLVRASRMARALGDGTRADELFAEAKELAPDHPAVVIIMAREGKDAERALEELRRAEQSEWLDDALRLELYLVEAGILLGLKRHEEAQKAFGAASRLEPDNLAVREFEAGMWSFEEQDALGDGREPNTGRLVRAAERFEELREEMRRRRRFEESGAMAARAAQAWAMGHNFGRAQRLLAEVASDGREYATEGGHRDELGQAALASQMFDLVPVFVPEDEDEARRLFRAQAFVVSDSETVSSGALAELDDLVEHASRGDVRENAAMARLAAAMAVPGLGWSDQAEAILRESMPWVVAMMNADRMRAAGEPEQAEAQLIPFHDRVGPLRMRVDFAADDEDWEKALRLSAVLIKTFGGEQDMLRRAELVERSGDKNAAHTELLARARNDALSAVTRARAFMGAIDTAPSLSASLEIGEEWSHVDPEDDNPRWHRLWCLLRLSRVDDAFGLWRERPLDPRTEQHAELATTILFFAGRPEEVASEIAEISDQFGRPEDLEARVVLSAMRAGVLVDPDPDEPTQRLSRRVEDFFERFPNSTIVRRGQIDADDPIGALTALLDDAGGLGDPERPKRIAETQSGIYDGQTAMAVFAHIVDRSVGEVWLRLGVLPLGYGRPDLEAFELSDARSALRAGAAVWDPSTLFIVGGLPKDIGAQLRAALPASVIAQATLDDAASALVAFESDDGERYELAFTGQGEVVGFAWPEDIAARDAVRGKGMLELARSFQVLANVSPDHPDELDAYLAQKKVDPAIGSWPATIIVGRRENVAVYSDDRVVRLSARQAGLPSFGTVALLQAMRDEEILEHSLVREARMLLMRSGGLGVGPSGDELIALAEESDFALTAALGTIFNDRLAWRERPRGLWPPILPFLERVFELAPTEFVTWVARAIDACWFAKGGDRDARDAYATDLLLLALDPISAEPVVSDACFRALVRAFKELPLYLRFARPAEVEVMALRQLRGWVAPQTRAQRVALLERALERFSREDEMLVRSFLEF